MPTNSKEYMKKNYKKYWWNPKAIEDRTKRNAARKKSWLAVGDPREVDHINGIAGWNGKWNIRILSRKRNRQLWAAKANMWK
jgi:hypothetical protein